MTGFMDRWNEIWTEEDLEQLWGQAFCNWGDDYEGNEIKRRRLEAVLGFYYPTYPIGDWYSAPKELVLACLRQITAAGKPLMVREAEAVK